MLPKNANAILRVASIVGSVTTSDAAPGDAPVPSSCSLATPVPTSLTFATATALNGCELPMSRRRYGSPVLVAERQTYPRSGFWLAAAGKDDTSDRALM